MKPMNNVSSCLVRLRTETRASHASIETVPILAKLLTVDFGRVEYIALLDAMHAFYGSIEPEIAGALESIPQLHGLLDGRRPRSLAEDLRWLGARPTRHRAPMPTIDCEAAGLGALYVIEGSGLGGRVIARHLADQLGYQSGQGASFYGGLSAEVARIRWQTLGEVLEMQTGASCQDVIVATARATFESMERWMRQVTVAQSQRSLTDDPVA
jgi:heme oxygenase